VPFFFDCNGRDAPGLFEVSEIARSAYFLPAGIEL